MVVELGWVDGIAREHPAADHGHQGDRAGDQCHLPRLCPDRGGEGGACGATADSGDAVPAPRGRVGRCLPTGGERRDPPPDPEDAGRGDRRQRRSRRAGCGRTGVPRISSDGRVVVIEPVVVVALEHEAAVGHGGDPVQDDGVQATRCGRRRRHRAEYVSAETRMRGPGVEPRFHADAVGGDVGRARRRGPEARTPTQPPAPARLTALRLAALRGCVHGGRHRSRGGRGGRPAAPPGRGGVTGPTVEGDAVELVEGHGCCRSCRTS